MSIVISGKDLIVAAKNNDVDVIAHCCNCFNTMGAGVAKAIVTAFPEAREVDMVTEKGYAGKLGTFTKTTNIGGIPPNYTPTVYNLYGQYGYGGDQRQLDYKSLEMALNAMADDIRRVNHILEYQGLPKERIGIPKLGCGLAGGDWNRVAEIIKITCPDLNITVYCP